MKVLGLDISKHMGFAILDGDTRVESGTFDADAESVGFTGKDKNGRSVVEEYGYIVEATILAHTVAYLVMWHLVDWIYIEQTNNGRNRTSQKNLEFLHYAILKELADIGRMHMVRYVDTSAWRSRLSVKMSKDQRKHNKKVKEKKARGKITTKHLAVAWANKRFALQLLQKDNNEADALAVALYGVMEQSDTQAVTPDIKTIDKALGIS